MVDQDLADKCRRQVEEYCGLESQKTKPKNHTRNRSSRCTSHPTSRSAASVVAQTPPISATRTIHSSCSDNLEESISQTNRMPKIVDSPRQIAQENITSNWYDRITRAITTNRRSRYIFYVAASGMLIASSLILYFLSNNNRNISPPKAVYTQHTTSSLVLQQQNVLPQYQPTNKNKIPLVEAEKKSP